MQDKYNRLMSEQKYLYALYVTSQIIFNDLLH